MQFIIRVHVRRPYAVHIHILPNEKSQEKEKKAVEFEWTETDLQNKTTSCASNTCAHKVFLFGQ